MSADQGGSVGRHAPWSIEPSKIYGIYGHQDAVDASGKQVLTSNDPELLQRIVTAVNQHALLVTRNQELLEALKDLRHRFHCAIIATGSDAWAADAACKKADAAIAVHEPEIDHPCRDDVELQRERDFGYKGR